MAPRRGHIFKPLSERLEERSIPEPNSGCFLWIGYHNGEGYGKLSVGKSGSIYAHRFAYEQANGPIPEGMQLDHLCRTPSCVNPDHLEPVTNRENTLRGRSSALKPKRVTCKHGHDLRLTAYVDTRGQQKCRECHRQYTRTSRLRRQAT